MKNLNSRTQETKKPSPLYGRNIGFVQLGIVFFKFVAARKDGYGIMYDALMKAATLKGADTIIRVSISSKGGPYHRMWFGTALAIRYLDSEQG